ncbi:MAG TPA: DUF2071 domain-containing protein [Polyangia bacterium]|nr:DUF2071 domain-containing protein [Polyangia bacterium]
MDSAWRAVGRQSWRDLLFLHQPIAVERLRALVPEQLQLDTFEGQAWVTLIPFRILGSRPVGAPRPLGMDFLEVNLRTYVRSPAGEPGIYFFSLEASSLLAVLGARLGYALPYFPAAISVRTDREGAIHYRSVRRLGERAALQVVWRVGPALGTATPGSRDHFLIERYLLFAVRGARLYAARVRHRPYPLCGAELASGRESLLAAAGLPPLMFPPVLAHHSPGVDVEISWRRRLRR